MEHIDILCDGLVDAFKQNQDDPLSIVATIDIDCEQVNAEGTVAEKEKYLATLLERLDEHPEILAKIGWDIPEILLQFWTSKNINMNKSLRSSAIIATVMKCFNTVALNSNPKECFLTSCEMLSKLNVLEIKELNGANDQDTVTSNSGKAVPGIESDEYFERNNEEFFFDLNLHIMFELMGTTLRRINTLYPSKYLGMASSAIMKVISTNVDYIDDENIILRRVFTFIRGYQPLSIPKEIIEEGTLSTEELKTISKSEAEIQGKLLRSLITTGISLCLRNVHSRLDVQYFNHISRKKFLLTEFYHDIYGMVSRYYQLAQTFDINLKDELLQYVEESKHIYHSLPADKDITSEQAREAISTAIYKLAYTYRLQKLTKKTELSLNSSGTFILAGFQFAELNQNILSTISIQDAIYMYMNYTTPSLYSKIYENITGESAARYWLWVALTTSPIKDLKETLAEMPSYFLNVFFEILLSRNVIEVNQELRMITFTLLTRLLCLVPENVAYGFIIKTLKTSPHMPNKSSVLYILKDMIIRKRQCTNEIEIKECELTDALEKLSIVEKPDESETEYTIPQRSYLIPSLDRMKELHDIALLDIDRINLTSSEAEEAILVGNYLNFFIAVSNVWDKKLLNIVHENVSSKFIKAPEKTGSEYEMLVSSSKQLSECIEGKK